MEAPYSSAAVANVIIEYANAQGKPVTNLALQKLVYFAHGWYLGIAGVALIFEEVKAWKYGPVFPLLYEALKIYGAGQVKELIPTAFKVEPGTDDHNFIRAIYDRYKDFSLPELIHITHLPDGPWYQVGGGIYDTIPNRIIKEYYSKKN